MADVCMKNGERERSTRAHREKRYVYGTLITYSHRNYVFTQDAFEHYDAHPNAHVQTYVHTTIVTTGGGAEIMIGSLDR